MARRNRPNLRAQLAARGMDTLTPRQQLLLDPRRGGMAAPGPQQFALDMDALECGYAEQAIEDYPNQTLDSISTHAYQALYPDGPNFPDFYSEDDTDYVYAWVRIRQCVDYFLHRPPENALAIPKPYPQPRPLASMGVPIETGGDPNPVWPVQSTDPRGCEVMYLDVHGQRHGSLPYFQPFGAPRGSSDWPTKPTRYHIGHDCIANPGDLVFAPENGVFGNIRGFYLDTKAMYIWTDTGLTINLGEIEQGSQQEFGATVGARVEKGQPVARVGSFDMAHDIGYNMIHFEIFVGQRDRSLNWYDGDPRPPDLRNPTDYLLRALAQCTTAPLGFAAEPMEEIEEASFLIAADPSPAMKH